MASSSGEVKKMKILDFFRTKPNPQQQTFQLSNLIEILQDGVCITNLTGDILYLNKVAYSLLGISPQTELSHLNFFENFIQNSQKNEALKKEINQRGLVKNKELSLGKLSGGFLEVILTVNIIGDFRNQTIGFLFLFKDMTEMKKIQQQLLQSQKLESIGLMASGIAHDFNNILAAIIPNAELIKYSSNQENENFRRAEIIEKSAHRASDIAQRLLTFTRQRDHNKEVPVKLNQVIQESFDILEYSIPKIVKVTNELEPNLHMVRADETQLQQIIMNLVINAVDAMPNGGKLHLRTENVQIENYYQIGSLDPGDYVHFFIKDTGFGIPQENITKIFDPFFTTKEIGKGTGLGLSMVYGIVKGLNGHIEVTSRSNVGTSFDIYLPVDAGLKSPELVETQESVNPKNFRILIIDDEEYVLNILGDILEFLGYQTIKKGSGSEGIEYYKEHGDDIDYLIIDIKMPKMDGRATFKELKRLDPDLKVIFTSGFDDTPMNGTEIDGCLGLLKKPYSINKVAKSLESFFVKA